MTPTDGPSRFDAPGFAAPKSFGESWEDAGLTDADLARLQVELGTDAEAGDVMAGTGGLRKVRYAKPGKGKSGGVRVCYANFPEYGVIYLFAVFEKNQRANLSKEEKNEAAVVLDVIRDQLAAAKARQDAANAAGGEWERKPGY
ncbi:MAG TPA: type II toxin-antitoxin system RelE/ParE family toxin [Urbifossiella sp.]|nr:type II toxin-antitoxin system RelE/ParE family toxin [Urbifossiella sp.]